MDTHDECKKTQSMFIISPEISKEIIKKIKNKKNYDFELIKKISKTFEFFICKSW